MLAEARTSAHPELDAAIRSRLDRVVELARDHFADSLRCVVLGGSLARGEALGVVRDGGLGLLSDLDLYFVAEDTGDGAAGFLAAMQEWADGDAFLLARPDAAVVAPGWFREGARTMPIHQLAHAHRVLWGEPVPIPAESIAGQPGRVDPRDAAELLFNRFVESLDPALDGGDGLMRCMHQTKEFIDAPMSWLAANGLYRPDRGGQLALVREMAGSLPPGPGAELEGCLEHWAVCLESRRKGLLEEGELRRLARPSGEEPAGRERRRDWAGGFALALLSERGLETTRECLVSGLPEKEFQESLASWLTREPLLRRLRRARRWCTVAPSGATPWWRHGAGGSAPDRIFAAAMLRCLDLGDWKEPIRALVDTVPGDDKDLHDLWWRWIQGRAD